MLKKILIGSIFSIAMITLSFADQTAKKIKIICFGDSITLAARVSKEQSFVGLLKEKLESKNLSFQIINAGVSGDKVSDGATRLKKSVLDLNPNIVIIMFGCNDSFIDVGKTKPRLPLDEFKKDLNAIVDELQQKSIKPILMTPTPIDNNKVNYYPYSFHGASYYLKPYVSAIREIAKTKKIALVDNFADWEKYCLEGGKVGDLLFDFVHPNKLGYAKMNDSIAPVLLNVVMNGPNATVALSEPLPEMAAIGKDKNLALGKSYISSSENSNNKWQAGLTDGAKTKIAGADSKVGGYATGKDTVFPKNVTIDLESIAMISKVLVYNMAKHGTKTVEVSLSRDGENFQEAGRHQFKKADGKVYTYTFPKQQARFVRITFLDYYKTSLNSNYMFLREVEVY
jgi:lysophospholipase L1-like esterase